MQESNLLHETTVRPSHQAAVIQAAVIQSAVTQVAVTQAAIRQAARASTFYLTSCVLFLVIVSSTLSAQEKSPSERGGSQTSKSVPPELESGFTWLFDGKTLEGWEGKRDWFRVEEGAIVAGSLKEKIPNNEFLCTKEKYADFELRLQVQLKGEGNNAGVQFRSSRVPNSHEVSGYQCDAGEASGRMVWGALYDESRRKKMLEGPVADTAKWAKTGDWNDLWIRCQGDHIQLWLNEHPTVDYREADATIPRSGVIGLQIHAGPPAEAWYRAIRIRPMKTAS